MVEVSSSCKLKSIFFAEYIWAVVVAGQENTMDHVYLFGNDFCSQLEKGNKC